MEVVTSDCNPSNRANSSISWLGGWFVGVVLYYTILYYTILYYTILYYTILYYTILYYTMLWHYRFGHPNFNKLANLVRDSERLYKDPIKISVNKEILCEACSLAKANKKVESNKNPTRAMHLLQVIHTDLCRPMSTISMGGANYFMAVVDDWSRFTTTFFLRHKSEAFEKFREYVAYAQRATGQLIKTLRTDNGGEFTSNEFTAYCREIGINH